METVTSWGKGRTDSTKQHGRWLGFGHALVVVSLLSAFVLLRVAHARQLEVTRKAFFLYSSKDNAAFDLARALNDQTGIAIYDLREVRTRSRLLDLGISWPGEGSGLLVPEGRGWRAVDDEQIIRLILAPLSGAPTPHLQGAFAALATAAIWLLGAVWRSSLAYLGSFWPILGIGALGIAMPFCNGCALADNRLTPAATTLGLLGFAAVLVALRLRKHATRSSMRTLAVLALAAGFVQAILLWLQPKFCVPCLVGTCAWVGVFCFGSYSASRPRVRAILVGRPATLVITVLALGLAVRHGYAALTQVLPSAKPGYDSLLGNPLASHYSPSRSFPKGLYLIGMPGCGACDLAQKRLREFGISYTSLSYCRLFQTENCVRSDFEEVSPLFVICDSQGIVTFAVAGWNEEPYSMSRFIERLKRLTSKSP